MFKFTLIEVFACGHARSVLSARPQLEPFCATAMTQITASNGHANCLYTNAYCLLDACQAQDFDPTIAEPAYDVDEHVRLDLLRAEYTEAREETHYACRYLKTFDEITLRTYDDLCIGLPASFSKDHDLANLVAVVLARMEEAIRSRAPRVTYEANATHAAFLLQELKAETADMVHFGGKIAQLQSQLDVAGLLRNIIYTPEDVENGTNIYWTACGEPIEREKIAMRIFQPHITSWSHVAMSASSVDDSGYDSDDAATTPATSEEDQAAAGQGWMEDPNSDRILHPCFKSTPVPFVW